MSKGRIIIDDVREGADGELWLGLVDHCKDWLLFSVTCLAIKGFATKSDMT